MRSQTLADQLTARDGPAKREANKLRELLGQTALEVERISRNLRPSILDDLGLVAVLRVTTTEFMERTGVPVTLACVPPPRGSLPTPNWRSTAFFRKPSPTWNSTPAPATSQSHSPSVRTACSS